MWPTRTTNAARTPGPSTSEDPLMPSNRTASAIALPAIAPIPSADPQADRDEAWRLRRLRAVARRRVRVAVAAIDTTAQIASDGELVIALEIVQERDPRVLAWR